MFMTKHKIEKYINTVRVTNRKNTIQNGLKIKNMPENVHPEHVDQEKITKWKLINSLLYLKIESPISKFWASK